MKYLFNRSQFFGCSDSLGFRPLYVCPVPGVEDRDGDPEGRHRPGDAPEGERR
jgi:hypothetical protein